MHLFSFRVAASGWAVMAFLVSGVCCGVTYSAEPSAMSVPTGIRFDENVFRSSGRGDNWYMTWAADGDIYTSLCDGYGWPDKNGKNPDHQNNQVIRIAGVPGEDSFRASPLVGAPDYSRSGMADIIDLFPLPEGDSLQVHPGKNLSARLNWTWYAYGIVSIDGDLYQFISHTAEKIGGFGWFDGVQLIWRPKGETQWKRWNGSNAHDKDRWLLGSGGNQLLFHNESNHAFSYLSIVQYGQDYQENQDGYVYLYSPEGRKRAHHLNLARVRKEHLLDRTKWEYFVRHTSDGGAEWAVNAIDKRGDVYLFPEGWGFYSWSPSVIWNEQLGLYLMASAGTQRPGTGDPIATYMHHAPASLKFLWAKQPWGPWQEFYTDEAWYGDHEENRTYLPQIAPKWISEDGKTMRLIYSDAGYRYGKNYLWNCQKFTLTFDDE